MCASRGMLGCYSFALLCQKTSSFLGKQKIPQETNTSLIITNMYFQGNLALFNLVVILANAFNCFHICLNKFRKKTYRNINDINVHLYGINRIKNKSVC